MSDTGKKLYGCFEYVRGVTSFRPRAAIVLGSGLGGFAEKIDVACVLPYREIPGFPCATVSGHEGRYLFGTVQGVPVVAMQGRVHYYEGYDMADVVLPIRVMGLLGAESLLLTNAAGGIRRDLEPGTLMLLKDHIASFVPSPLRGENVDLLGTRFPDMTEVYDDKFRTALKARMEECGISLKEGVYLQAAGPQYETPAEIRMYAAAGADAVGMSTACEAIAARHMGLKVCAVSCITNKAAGIGGRKLSHDEVKENGKRCWKMLEATVTEALCLAESKLS